MILREMCNYVYIALPLLQSETKLKKTQVIILGVSILFELFLRYIFVIYKYKNRRTSK